MNTKAFLSKLMFRLVVGVIEVAALLLLLLLGSALAEGTSGKPETPGNGNERTTEEKGVVLWQKDGLSISISGLFEAGAGYSYDYGRHTVGEGAADIALTEWHIDLDVSYRKTVEAHATLLWEEDDTEPVELDEGWARYIRDGFFIGGGRRCLPFGTFDTFFVSDPFTLELGEMHESGLFFGYESDTVTLTAMVTNGDLVTARKPAERLDLWAAAIDFEPQENIEVRLSWVSNIAEGDGFLAGALSSDPSYERSVGGLHASIHIAVACFECLGEFVMPSESFSRNDLDADGDGHGDRPAAANFEIACLVRDGKWRFAARFEAARQLAGVPVRRSGVAAAFAPNENTEISVECLAFVFDRRFTPGFSRGYSVSVQLAVGF